uniref:Pentatricopeptide repeat-containing protein n=1 Tax=Kalanchoe fedtschenkoi TaxID=63787 RepID=A0A7N0THG1_KALFE
MWFQPARSHLLRPPPQPKSLPLFRRLLSTLPWAHLLPSDPDASPLPRSLSQTKQAHALSLLLGYLPRSVSVSASLILSYASAGDVSPSRHLFRRSLAYSRSAFLWNTLIRAFSIAGLDEGLALYNRMVRAGVPADDHTFPFVIKACLDFQQVRKGFEVHGSVVKLGLDGDVFVCNNLLMLYGGCKELNCARKLFDGMVVRDVISWNTIVGVFALNGCHDAAVQFFEMMITSSSCVPNLVTVVSILPACAGLEDAVKVSEIHCRILKLGLDHQVTSGNALVDAYGKCGDSVASMRVFDGMAVRNVVSWNSVITSCTYRGHSKEAFDIFRSMIAAGESPNDITISSLLPVLVELEYFSKAKEIHAFSVRIGVESEVFVANSLIDMYAKSGCSIQASNVFHKMSVRNVVSWNAMISNFAQNKIESAALGFVRLMQEYGECPNSVTFTNLLPACARLGSPLPGKEIHGRSIRTGSDYDLFVSNALTDMYAKCGCLNLARHVFNTSLRDEVSYNILIIGYSETSDCIESLELFREMGVMSLRFDVVSYVGALSACSNLNALKQGKELHGYLIRRLVHCHLFVANSLLDLYTKCGRIDVAVEIFNQIPKKDAASWNTLILGYGMLGNINTAIDFFEAMKEDNVEYDSVSYIAVLSACSHGGLVEKGRRYFKEMQVRDIAPTQMHYACMVDLLGRAGLMKEAAELIKRLPVAPDANIWGALLGAARIYGDLEMGSWAANHLFELKPEHCGYYILLSNMYAEAGKWSDAVRIRRMMRSKGVKKSPAYSWVQLRDQAHAFLVGGRLDELDNVVHGHVILG